MNRLKPCPFCGGEAIYMDRDTIPDRQQPTIICDDCSCSMAELSKDFLIESWNERVELGSIKSPGAEIKRLTNERDYWKEEAWKARKESLQHKCLSDTEVFMRLVQVIEVETSNAIRSNRAVIRERVEKRGADRLTDPICCVCAGKVAALDGIWNFIEDIVKELEFTEGGDQRGV